MILSGKSKIDFIEFYWNNYIGKTRFSSEKADAEDFFYSLYPILKHALLTEWLDSVGIYIKVSYGVISESWQYRVQKEVEGFFASRNQATEKAIEKAIEIYNSK